MKFQHGRVRHLLFIYGVSLFALGVTQAEDPVVLPELPSAPETQKLKQDLGNLKKTRDEIEKDLSNREQTAKDREALKQQLAELVKKLSERELPPQPAPKPKEVNPSPIPFEIPTATETVDTLRMAQNLYQANQVEAALKAFQLLETTKLTADDLIFQKYMMACCQRRLGRISEASVLYRDVVDSSDRFLKECALWQLSMLKSTQEIESQIELIRSKRKSR